SETGFLHICLSHWLVGHCVLLKPVAGVEGSSFMSRHDFLVVPVLVVLFFTLIGYFYFLFKGFNDLLV
ncbi:hypothetical protein, partial [Erwinia amylovora]|uniref:hypothetical protein n=1 Tax=Erwinia amylovora TaxID=552 RepID=UPI0020BF6AB5